MSSTDFDYTEVRCPMSGCGEPLALDWTCTYLLSIGDLAGPMQAAPENAHTQRWTVGCVDGHVLLTPGDLGCGCADPEGPTCEHDPTAFDWSDESRAFHDHDLRRLRDQLALIATPTTPETGA